MKFIVPKNWHYCINFLPGFKINDYQPEVNATVMFTEESKYTDVNEPSAVNKLFGQCYGITGVHKESDRFGWVYDQDSNKFKLYAYSYNNGVLNKHYLCDLEQDKEYQLDIQALFNSPDYARTVLFFVNNKLVYDPMYTMGNIPFGVYTLGLYFGGNNPAPNTIKVQMK